MARETPKRPIKVSFQVSPRIRRYMYEVRGLYLVSFFALIGISGVTAAKAWIVQPIGDALFQSGFTSEELKRLCFLVASIFALQAVLNLIHGSVAKTAGARIVRAMRRDVFAHLLTQDRSYFVVRSSGELLSRVINDIMRFEAAAGVAVQNIVRDALTLVLLFGVMLLQSWKLSLVSVVAVGGVGLFLSIMNQRIRIMSRRAQEIIAQVVRELSEVIAGMEVVVTFRAGRRWRERFQRVNDSYYDTAVRLERTNVAVMSTIQLAIGVGIAVILFVAGRTLLAGAMTEGQFLSFLAAGYLLQTPVVGIGGQMLNFTRGIASGERALELLDDRPSLVDPPNPTPLPDTPLPIEFRSVSYAYQDERILDSVSFSIAPGERAVIVGESGAGKSTLAKLLLRFDDPVEGSILLGDVPLPELARDSLYRVTAYVSQEVFMFETTIRENLLIGAADATDAQLMEALATVGMKDFIDSLPDGIETEVRERGLRLSGGQRQRLAIARALLCDAEILVLDEATSALDMESERMILRNLFALPHPKTIIGISHRLSVAHSADRVLSLKDGRVVEDGPAHVLAEQDGEFARLCRAAAV